MIDAADMAAYYRALALVTADEALRAYYLERAKVFDGRVTKK